MLHNYGKEIFYYDDPPGAVQTERHYNDKGQLDGIQTTYKKNGMKHSEVLYRDGQQIPDSLVWWDDENVAHKTLHFDLSKSDHPDWAKKYIKNQLVITMDEYWAGGKDYYYLDKQIVEGKPETYSDHLRYQWEVVDYGTGYDSSSVISPKNNTYDAKNLPREIVKTARWSSMQSSDSADSGADQGH